MPRSKKVRRALRIGYVSMVEVKGNDLHITQQDYPGSVLVEKVLILPLTRCSVEDLAMRLWEWHRREVKSQSVTESFLRGE